MPRKKILVKNCLDKTSSRKKIHKSTSIFAQPRRILKIYLTSTPKYKFKVKILKNA